MSKLKTVKPYKNKAKSYFIYKEWLKELFFHNTCAYCLLNITPDNETIDHYQPQKHFPELRLNPDNLLLCCSKCNRNKSDCFSNPKIFNCRKENLGNLIEVDKEGRVNLKKKRQFTKPFTRKATQRVIDNIKILKLNTPEKIEARKGLFEFLHAIGKNNVIDNYLASRYLFFFILNINIPKSEKVKLEKCRKQRIKNEFLHKRKEQYVG